MDKFEPAIQKLAIYCKEKGLPLPTYEVLEKEPNGSARVILNHGMDSPVSEHGNSIADAAESAAKLVVMAFKI